jgi:large subunit ribosomal protein L22
MGKQARPRTLPENEVRAIGRTIRTSPRKLNLVAELTFSKRRIAQTVKKVLQAAIANAENNHQLDVDRLVVAEAHVGKSLTMRRFHPRGRGRSAPVVKSFSHITVVVRETAEASAKESA